MDPITDLSTSTGGGYVEEEKYVSLTRSSGAGASIAATMGPIPDDTSALLEIRLVSIEFGGGGSLKAGVRHASYRLRRAGTSVTVSSAFLTNDSNDYTGGVSPAVSITTFTSGDFDILVAGIATESIDAVLHAKLTVSRQSAQL